MRLLGIRISKHLQVKTNKSVLQILLLSIFCLFGSSSYSQQNSTDIDVLRSAVVNAKKNLKTDFEGSYIRLDSLMKVAIELEDKESELNILDGICLYYYFNSDLDELLKSANSLRNKAVEYENLQFEGTALVYRARVFTLNGFLDKAETEIQEALEILGKVNNDERGKVLKANAHIFYSGIFAEKGEQEQVINQLKLASREYTTFKDLERKRVGLFNNYSNIADEYAYMGIADSARHYHNLAISLRQEPENTIWLMNYRTLGYIELLEGDTLAALEYFQESEEIAYRTGDKYNLPAVYEEILGIAKSTDDHELASEYLEKANKIILESSEDKNKVLRQMIEQLETEKSAETHKRNRTLLTSGLLLLIAAAFAVWFYRKNKQTKNFQDAKGEIVSLLEMVKNDDPSFMHAFGNTFPNFTKKLLGLSPELTSSEIEICALIKLKVGTKQIARLRAISHRTVQNKKYSIRKKLNIPSEVDFEEFIDKL